MENISNTPSVNVLNGLNAINEANMSAKMQIAINKLAIASGNMLLLKAAKALGRTDVQYVKTDTKNVEIYVTMSVKPDKEGFFTVLRNGELITIKANAGQQTDVLPVTFSFEIYGQTETNMRGKVSRKVSKTTIRKFTAYLENGVIVLKRYSTKELIWENAQLPNSINRADFTESDLNDIVAEKLAAFYNRLDRESEPLKQRQTEYNGESTLFGIYKNQ